MLPVLDPINILCAPHAFFPALLPIKILFALAYLPAQLPIAIPPFPSLSPKPQVAAQQPIAIIFWWKLETTAALFPITKFPVPVVLFLLAKYPRLILQRPESLKLYL